MISCHGMSADVNGNHEMEVFLMLGASEDMELGPSTEKRTEVLIEAVKNVQRNAEHASALHAYVS